MKVKFRTIIFVLLAVVTLLALFFLLKPKENVQTLQVSQKTGVPATAESNIKTFELVVKEKKLAAGSSVLKVDQGDEVTLKITSDESEEFHVHAYDVSVELVPDEQATLTFSAKISGRFPFELEESKTELGVIEVQPK